MQSKGTIPIQTTTVTEFVQESEKLLIHDLEETTFKDGETSNGPIKDQPLKNTPSSMAVITSKNKNVCF